MFSLRTSLEIFISHDLSVVVHLANYVAVMYRGVICEKGPVAELLNPPYTEALLSAIPRLGDKASERPRIRLRGDVRSMIYSSQGCRFHLRCPRKIGKICGDEVPPILEPFPGHQITCHLSINELQKAKPVI